MKIFTSKLPSSLFAILLFAQLYSPTNCSNNNQEETIENLPTYRASFSNPYVTNGISTAPSIRGTIGARGATGATGATGPTGANGTTVVLSDNTIFDANGNAVAYNPSAIHFNDITTTYTINTDVIIFGNLTIDPRVRLIIYGDLLCDGQNSSTTFALSANNFPASNLSIAGTLTVKNYYPSVGNAVYLNGSIAANDINFLNNLAVNGNAVFIDENSTITSNTNMLFNLNRSSGGGGNGIHLFETGITITAPGLISFTNSLGNGSYGIPCKATITADTVYFAHNNHTGARPGVFLFGSTIAGRVVSFEYNGANGGSGGTGLVVTNSSKIYAGTNGIGVYNQGGAISGNTVEFYENSGT